MIAEAEDRGEDEAVGECAPVEVTPTAFAGESEKPNVWLFDCCWFGSCARRMSGAVRVPHRQTALTDDQILAM